MAKQLWIILHLDFQVYLKLKFTLGRLLVSLQL